MATAIIVAGGRGLRMNNAIPKQYLLLSGQTILGRALKAFSACQGIAQIKLVVPEFDMELCRSNILPPLKINKPIALIAGGKERQDSVYNGLLSVDDSDEIVVIHDGVRPFVRPEQIAGCISGVKAHGACIMGIPAFDTLKRVDADGQIEETIDRNNIWLAQTPQAFRYSIIRQAHENAARDGFYGTDDACLVERMGIPVKIIGGSRTNIKITTRGDLKLAQALLRAESV